MAGYTAVRPLQNPKVGIAFTLVLVFLVGAVVGALAMNLGVHKGLHRVPFWTDPGRQISLQRLQKELDLTPEQTDQLKTALDDFSRYYQDVLAIGKTSIYKILNEQQKHKFDQLMNEAQK
jgi:Spy/CpxP family protein refolding chaperone